MLHGPGRSIGLFQKLLRHGAPSSRAPHGSFPTKSACDRELVCLFFANLYIFPHPSQIQKGISSARSDDTKSLKGVVLEWISPPNIPVHPPLSRNVKTNRGYHHPVTGALLCPAGLDWNDVESVFLPSHVPLTPLIPPFSVP